VPVGKLVAKVRLKVESIQILDEKYGAVMRVVGYEQDANRGTR
jgi:hypothetical protein